MTVLDEYDRLEATGVFYPDPRAQRRDVVVSIGTASLTITDLRDTALAHWSLPAVERLNPGRMPALYAPAEDAPERLEINDDEMIAAIERVRRALWGKRARSGGLRRGAVTVACLGLLVLGVFWLPDALRSQAAALLPPAARATLGADFEAELVRLTGAPCDDPLGRQALSRLAARVLGPDGPAVTVLPSSVFDTVHGPGGRLYLSRSVVEDHETPAVAAGYLIAEDARRQAGDPARQLLASASLADVARLLTTGGLPRRAVATHAEALLARPLEDVPTADLIARFEAAGLSSTPYAFALDVSGESTIALIEADPHSDGATAPALSDGDWIALQGICGE